ncbi:MAG: nuclear transport factor 2 family protein [Planctomycetota bacterium]
MTRLARARVSGMAAALWLATVTGAPGQDDARVAAVLAADDARIAAMTAADPEALAPLLSPELRYSHSNGTVDTKDSFLKLIGGKTICYVAYRPIERGIRFASPEIALEHGRAEVVLEKNGARTEATFLFLAVWRLEEGQWRFLEWQSARPAATP